MIFFTGLSAAGKSTIAKAVVAKLSKGVGQQVTLLDGDAVRQQLSPELGFSKEDRDRNVRRVGLIASEIVKDGGIAVCALIAPYDHARREIRALIENDGGRFFLVYVATPLAICEKRDPKGLYARARAGDLLRFTGISDPYEAPLDAELIIGATDIAPEEAARRVTDRFTRECYWASERRPEFVSVK